MILVFDGTSDSRELCMQLISEGYDLICSVVTGEAAKKLESLNIRHINGRLDRQNMIDFINNNKINAVIDATHPFAESIHKTALDVSNELNMLHIRFERKPVKINSKNVLYAGFNEINDLLNDSRNIFVTTGIKTVKFYEIDASKNYYFRIIPDPENIMALIDHGVPQSNIIAIEGKLNYMVNYSIMQYFNIDTMVTKDSGFLSEPKINAALDLGIKTIIIKRPDYKYKNMAYTYKDVLKILKEGGIYPES
ncbi:precorrin-6A reductase [Acidiplasma aeolicum]|jgi:precorrin-6A/cobalt-precorrin-6A reductase|uniref:precorrin-6A reductase n=1 Tax=Acidiplasma aeolicum TaxID=507754 RepID=UPI0037123597